MGVYNDAIIKLGESIASNDTGILIAAFFALVLVVLTVACAWIVKHASREWKEDKDKKSARHLWHITSICYSLFITMISIFPLLGMFGTVMGLLGLDLTNGNMENIRNNFFIALTSTAWGIIFSVIFKIVNAFIEDYVEEQIETSKKFSERIKTAVGE